MGPYFACRVLRVRYRIAIYYTNFRDWYTVADPDIPFGGGGGMKWDWMSRELSGVLEGEK